jgi:hypothetical protein
MYELKLKETTIPLRWGTWAMKRFCELENKTLMELINVLSSGVYNLDTIVHIVQSAAESGYKSLKRPVNFEEFDVCNWIDEVGGLTAKDGQLVEFMKYMQNSMVPDLKDNKPTEEKKN